MFVNSVNRIYFADIRLFFSLKGKNNEIIHALGFYFFNVGRIIFSLAQKKKLFYVC